MKKVYNLDDLFISPRIYKTWVSMLPFWIAELKEEADKKNIRLTPDMIPDEQFRELSDGIGEIFVQIPSLKEISLRVPKGEWKKNNKKRSG